MTAKGIMKKVHWIPIRKGYPCSQFETVSHDNGTAITNAIASRIANSRYNNFNMPVTDAPNTFLMPISFVR